MEHIDYFIGKLELAKPKHQFAIVKTLWTSDSLSLELAQFEKCDTGTELHAEFEGILDSAQLHRHANDFGWPIDDLIAKWKESLSTNVADFTFEMVDNHLQWFKVDVVRVKYGCIELKEVQPKYKICIGLLQDSINQSTAVAKNHAENCKKLETKEKHSADMKAIYDAYVDEQKAKERTYLTKFTLLLNEKKARIRQLESIQAECNDPKPFDSNIQESEEFDINSTPDLFELPKRSRMDDAQPSTSYHHAKTATDDIYELDTQPFNDLDKLCVKS